MSGGGAKEDGGHVWTQIKIDDEWYTIPVKLSNYGFNDLGYILKPHESNEMVCDLTPYGELESEMYRIEKEGIVAEFEKTIKNEYSFIRSTW